MLRRCLVALWMAVTALAGLVPAHAEITPLAHWRSGENDPGATAGGAAAATTQDFAPNDYDATTADSLLYSGSTPLAGSGLSLDFLADTDVYSRSVVTTAIDNWGLETWVYLDVVPDLNVVLYHGESGGNGFGLLIRTIGGSPKWHTLIGSIEWGNTGVEVDGGQWVHVAAVRDSGTLQLYVNGTATGTSFTKTPGTPSGSVTFGNLDGRMDEVRVFEFEPGQFDPATDLLSTNANLLAAIPEPGSLALAVSAGLLLLPVWRRRCNGRSDCPSTRRFGFLP